MADINLRSFVRKDLLKDLTADKLFELEKANIELHKIKAQRTLDGINLASLKITRTFVAGVILLAAVLMGLGITIPTINKYILSTTAIKNGYYIIGENTVKKEDAEKALEYNYKLNLAKEYKFILGDIVISDPTRNNQGKDQLASLEKIVESYIKIKSVPEEKIKKEAIDSLKNKITKDTK